MTSRPAKAAPRDEAIKAFRIILGLAFTSVIIALVIWSSAIITRFLIPVSFEAENVSQPALSYRLLERPFVVSGQRTSVRKLAGLARGGYDLSITCAIEGEGGVGSGTLLASINGREVGQLRVSHITPRAFSCPIDVSTSTFELGVKFEADGECSLRIDQIELRRTSDLLYKHAADRYGLPGGRRIDFQNPLQLGIDVPANAFGLLVRARVDELSLGPPELTVSADSEQLGNHTMFWLKWSDYLFGLRDCAEKTVRLSLNVANARGIAIVDHITILQRSKNRAYFLNILGSFLEACSAYRDAAKCYLASLRFYPENWRSKNELLQLLLEQGMADEAAVLLHFFDRFQPHFSDPRIQAEQLSRAAAVLVAYHDTERAVELIDRYFRTYDPTGAAELLSQKMKSLRGSRKTANISEDAWTLVPARDLWVGIVPALSNGREVSMIEDALSGRRDTNVLVQERRERRLLEQIYDVPSGVLSPNFVLADPDNAEKLVSGWDKPQGESVVWGTGASSVLAVDIERPNDVLLTFRVKPRFVYNLLPRMVVSFNAEPLREIILLPGWHEYQTFVPAQLQNRGANELTLGYKYFGADTKGDGGPTDRKVAFHYIEWWRTDERFKDRFIYETGTIVGDHRFEIDGDVRQTLFVHPPRAVFYPIVIWPDTTLSFGLGISEKIWDRGGDGTLFRVLLYPENRRDTDAEPIVLLERFLDACGSPDERHWFDYQLDLSGHTGTVGKLAFETLPGEKGDVWYDWSGFSDPTIWETIEYIDLSGKSLSASIRCRGGRYTIAVLAKGAPVKVLPPWLAVMIDGEHVQTLLIKHPEWAPYWLTTDISAGHHTITLYFANEMDLSQSWEPMRVLIGGVGFLPA